MAYRLVDWLARIDQGGIVCVLMRVRGAVTWPKECTLHPDMSLCPSNWLMDSWPEFQSGQTCTHTHTHRELLILSWSHSYKCHWMPVMKARNLIHRRQVRSPVWWSARQTEGYLFYLLTHESFLVTLHINTLHTFRTGSWPRCLVQCGWR